MMNKKILAVMMAVVMILALVLVGCGKPSENIVPGSSSANGTGVENWDDVVIDNSGNSQQSGSSSGSTSGSSSGSASGSASGSTSGSSSGSSSGSLSGVGKEDYGITYEEYQAMDPYEKQAYFEELGLEEFKKWYNAAKYDFDVRQDAIRIEGDGGFNIGDYLKPKQ